MKKEVTCEVSPENWQQHLSTTEDDAFGFHLSS
jgi:hypothetical protein